MNRTVRNHDLRVCGTCWSVVHPADLPDHDRWHEAVRADAVAEVARAIGRVHAQPAF